MQENLQILGNQDKLRQAFLNIIVNGIQAMESEENPSLFILKTLAKLLYIPSAGSSVNSFFFYYGGLALTGILLISREGLDG